MKKDTDIYLDHASAMRPDPRILDFYREAALRGFVNQEASHGAAYRIRRELADAAVELAEVLSVPGCRVVWGSSGSALAALVGGSPVVAGRRVLSSQLEHPAVSAALRRGAAQVVMLPNRADGRIQMPAKPDGEAVFELLAIHHVQSELGVAQDFDGLAAAARTREPGIFVWCDAVQSAGRLALPHDFDCCMISGHKFGAPGGAALLLSERGERALRPYVEKARHLDYLIGRPDPAMCLALTRAAGLAAGEMAANLQSVRSLNALCRTALTGMRLPGGGVLKFTVEAENSSPYILHFILPGLQAAVVVRMLSELGVEVASGSACASETRVSSPVLAAVGVPKRDGFSGMRVSFAPSSTAEEAEKFLECFRAVLKNY
ncbi:MAG: aminotransferase class V-fold PLP-dependent enzyme [Victivallaceae bacterium]|nr:aminotransferase class V-fold PLP-dependent enzyme [Victivallaceae bacterium]